jgi:hypothetical protein
MFHLILASYVFRSHVPASCIWRLLNRSLGFWQHEWAHIGSDMPTTAMTRDVAFMVYFLLRSPEDEMERKLKLTFVIL